MSLTEYNAKYESIIRSNISDRQKALKLADLMTDMEGQLKNEIGEHRNKEVNALYKKKYPFSPTCYEIVLRPCPYVQRSFFALKVKFVSLRLYTELN
ncbi:hypothetical protein KEH51_07715 [[Brevibacterium] frigoritolerans]|uniref:Uncharacterized protein n=1 Tax=Peribacillus frigoritolerans TaxID=450367 RepID=A0A941FQV6_9BACI|nr:hypothetical protein [Peribacillus frigoritolerans]